MLSNAAAFMLIFPLTVWLAAGLVITTEGGVVSSTTFSSLSTYTVTGIRFVLLPLLSVTVAEIKWSISSA